METSIVLDTETVVRVISHVLKDGAISPTAFKLRQWPEPKGGERYISVNRYNCNSFVIDLHTYDKGRNLPCAKLNVGEIRAINLFLGSTDKHPVKYDVRDMHSKSTPSHAGIFISVANMPLEGSGDAILDSIEGGKEKDYQLLAIRSALANIVQKPLTTVEVICKEKASNKPAEP